MSERKSRLGRVPAPSTDSGWKVHPWSDCPHEPTCPIWPCGFNLFGPNGEIVSLGWTARYETAWRDDLIERQSRDLRILRPALKRAGAFILGCESGFRGVIAFKGHYRAVIRAGRDVATALRETDR